MARILFLNSVCYGSTGSICKNLYRMAEEEGHECCIAYGRGKEPEGFRVKKIGSNVGVLWHVAKARLFDASGFASKYATEKFVAWLERYKPDVIHMHNLHGYYINIELFFEYLKKHPEIKKIWTLHDCWSFTGHCPHFQYENCEQWRNGCKKCCRLKEYPKSYVDNCENNYRRKKEAFQGVKNMSLVSPSKWLLELAKKSYLAEYDGKTIYNGINTEVFKPVQSSVLEKYGVADKKIVLAVSSVWGKKKGLDSILDMAETIDDRFKIVIIGLSNSQIKKLPSNILGIEKTENVQELVEWYSAASVFVNPSLEDTYPTVNLEAQACGTYSLVFNTGGMKETIKYCNGAIVNSIEQMKNIIENDSIPPVNLQERELYDWKYCFGDYLKLYIEG